MTGGYWHVFQTEGAPTYSRLCDNDTVVPVPDLPALDLCDALPTVDEYSLAMYAETDAKAQLARAMDLQASATDMKSFGSMHRLVKRSTRHALVQGDLRLADGRSDPAFFGGFPRLLQDYGLWERGELPHLPIQIMRLRELEAAGIDAVEFATSAAVDMRFGLQLGRRVVICRRRFRAAEKVGRVRVTWSR